MSNKTRLDVLLTERGLLDSRQKAQATIMSGIVFVDGKRVDKAGTMVSNDSNIEIRGTTLKYVSRGGLKLEKAMQTFPLVCCARAGRSPALLSRSLKPDGRRWGRRALSATPLCIWRCWSISCSMQRQITLQCLELLILPFAGRRETSSISAFCASLTRRMSLLT